MSRETEFKEESFRRPIRQLDQTLINKIAAGEVVERPASVVKELVENAFDAGATAVDIMARKAGTTLISVVDNGCGIHSNQIELAFSRHATSKIRNVDDLFTVHSFGFRGEALPSIASVSSLAMTTRHFSEAAGTYVLYEGGKEIDKRPAAAPVGTKVEVSHLFFNTPARRKFLKVETTESRQIIRIAERMALSKPSIAVSLNLNERDAFRLPPGQPIAERMAALFAVKADSIVEYDVEMSDVSYLVYLAHPDQARHDRTRICLFINGRTVASSTLIHAVTSGYGEFLSGGQFPLACVYISVAGEHLDVNVHPTKAEVRLSEERAIHDNLYRIVKKALRDWRLVPSEKATGVLPSAGSKNKAVGADRKRQSFGKIGHSAGGSFFHPSQLPPSAIPAGSNVAPLRPEQNAACDSRQPVVEHVPSESSAPAGVDSRDITFLGRLGQVYLLTVIDGELFIIDQHAAHERVLYEEILEQVERGQAVGQKLLFSETVELSAEEYLTYEENAALLDRMGFEIGPFGGKAIIVSCIPALFRDRGSADTIRALLDDMASLNKAGGEMVKAMAQSMACRAAVMAGDQLKESEVQNLIKKLLAAGNPYCCPHGRPTFIKISREELDGRFQRT